MSDNSSWTFEDGWILMSLYVVHGDEGALLEDMVGAADGMNHAIPTSGELSHSLTRLASCGILSRVGDRFRITDEYLPMLCEACKSRGGLFQTPHKGIKWLSSMEFDVEASVDISVSDDQLTQAYNKYRKRGRNK